MISAFVYICILLLLIVRLDNYSLLKGCVFISDYILYTCAALSYKFLSFHSFFIDIIT